MGKEKLIDMDLQYFAEEEAEATDQVDNQEAEETEAKESKTLSQEEVNRLVAQQKSKAKDEAKKEYEETLKQIRAEMEELKTSQMPEDEAQSYKQQKEEEKRQQLIAKLEEREKSVQMKEDILSVQSALSEKDINKDFVHFLVDTGKYKTLEDRIEAFTDVITAQNEEILENGVKKALSGTPPRVHTNGGSQKKKFSELSYAERLELKKNDEKQYQQLLKEND